MIGLFGRSLWARVQRRIVYATIAAIMTGTLTLLWTWLGLPDKFNPAPIARPLREIWWHFPAYAAVGFLLVLLMPKSFERDLGL